MISGTEQTHIFCKCTTYIQTQKTYGTKNSAMPRTVTLGIALLAKNVRLWSGTAIRNNDKREKKFLFRSNCLLLNLRTKGLVLGFVVVKIKKLAKRS